VLRPLLAARNHETALSVIDSRERYWTALGVIGQP